MSSWKPHNQPFKISEKTSEDIYLQENILLGRKYYMLKANVINFMCLIFSSNQYWFGHNHCFPGWGWITVTVFHYLGILRQQAPQSSVRVMETSLGFVVGTCLWTCKEGYVCVKESCGSNLGKDLPRNLGFIIKPAGLPLTANAECGSLILYLLTEMYYLHLIKIKALNLSHCSNPLQQTE